MNKVILLGRLTRDPEVKYTSGAEPMAVCRYTLAVNRSYSKDKGKEQEADFINIVAFGKRGEWASKYFHKGQQVAVVGELRTNSYDDKDGKRQWSANVVVSEQHFAGSKPQEAQQGSSYTPPGVYPQAPQGGGQEFDPVYGDGDEDLPF